MPRRILRRIGHEYIIIPPRELVPRGSASEFCKIAFALKQWAMKDGWVERKTMRDDLILETGKIIHELWQKWMGILGVLYGDWTCLSCKIVNRGFDNICPKCKSIMFYQELEYSDPFCLHIDAPVRLNPYPGPPDSVWDFKSTSQERFETVTQPPLSYVTQIQCYAQVLKEQEGFPIRSAGICYINRNRPYQSKFIEVPVKKVHNKILNNYKNAEKSANEGKIDPTGIYDRENDTCIFCDWNKVCGSPNPQRVIKRMHDRYVEVISTDRKTNHPSRKNGR